MRRFILLLVVDVMLAAMISSTRAQDGFCMINGTTTGGTGGPTVTVTNGTDFNTQINIAGPRIIQVEGVVSIGRVFTTANKTIIGLGTNATLLGNINVSDVTNVIIRNLRVTGPANDGFTIWNAQHVWIDHCTFYDTGDGLCDMNRGSQYVTVSWCKFHYINQMEHRFTMIADGYVNAGVTNFGYYTLHHNWWSTGSHERMPASSIGRIHMYNNYFNCTNNFYASNARNDTEINSENNYYSGVTSPVSVSSGTTGKIKTSGNLYPGCNGTIDSGLATVFVPPYGYSLDLAVDVPSIVRTGAGAPGPHTVSIPPKIWDGGGSGNNWNTANNWALDETPKVDDILIFAGNTRLTPNNNITANTEYYGLTFSNNAGAFILGGNTLNIGGPIVDDSTAAQTINLNMDLSFGQFHYPTGRVIDVRSPAGSLVINGAITGTNNAYFDSYSLAKQGDGLLVLNGINTFRASLFINGGWLRFNALNTNQAGSLGVGTAIVFNGGGLQWAAGNAADLSARAVTVNSNGAALDVGANSVSFAGRIGNGGSGSLLKSGSGTLTFSATNNYRGNTIIAEGVLALTASGLLTNSPQIILSNNAVLDVSARSDGTQTLINGRRLTGNGTVRGSVTAANGATISPGFSIGTVVITNVLTLQAGSTNVMELDVATGTNDLITGAAVINYGGVLVLTNLNGNPMAGGSFKLFNAGSYNNSFSTIQWPALSGNLIWTNRLAIDGSIAVITPVNTAVTNITATLAGDILQLMWPFDHTGWRLETQTNQLSGGISTNWSTVAGSEATNFIQLSIDPANPCVFFRLTLP